jgi:hypothetical protein
MLRIDCDEGSIYVHRHLLCGRSDDMTDSIENSEVVIDSSLSKIKRESGRWLGNMDKRAWELYIGFLYGQPIWTRNEQFTIDQEFEQLVEMWEDGWWSSFDLDAADAAMDAIRELVMQHIEGLSRPFNALRKLDFADFEEDAPVKFLADFMVYGQSGRVFSKWYDAYVNDYKDGCLDAELGVRFSEKAAAMSERRDLPNLMERCRYHSHRDDPDRCCYLDK